MVFLGRGRLQYLADLSKEASILPWAAVDPDHADPKRGESLGLADIYTALDTTETDRSGKEGGLVRGLAPYARQNS